MSPKRPKFLTLWGEQRLPKDREGECRWGDPEVLGDGTLVFPKAGHPHIDGFERQADGKTFVRLWPECLYALNRLGLRRKANRRHRVTAKRNCMHEDHPLYKKLVRYGDCENCPLVLLLEDWDDEVD